MEKSLSFFLFWIIWVISLEASVGKGVARRCSPIELENGKVKIKSRGRVAKFKCRKGYTLFEGDRFATCVRDKWNGKIPKCISSGCEYYESIPNGETVYLYNEALVQFLCMPGYTLEGSPALSCDGEDWNGTVPLCQAPTNAALTCDFEDASVCGWMNGEFDHFDWTRNQGPTASFGAGTGPKVDHTLGTELGHYMYIESSIPREEGDTARLYSPVYQASVTDTPACFGFYFHMFGNTTGNLNAYIKPESANIENIPPVFQMSSYNSDKWILHVIHLNRMVSNFQVVLEGVRGSGYMSDIAIDDVQLAQGDDCDRLDEEVGSQYDNVLTHPTRGPPTEATTNSQTTGSQISGRQTTQSPSSIPQTTESQTAESITTKSQAHESQTINSQTTSPTVNVSESSANSSLVTTVKQQETDNQTFLTTKASDASEVSQTNRKTEPILTTVPSTAQPLQTTELTTVPEEETTEASNDSEEEEDEHKHDHDDEDGDKDEPKHEDLNSCKNRCGEIAMETNTCGCDIVCNNSKTCCPDLQQFCPGYFSTPSIVTAKGMTDAVTTDSMSDQKGITTQQTTSIQSKADNATSFTTLEKEATTAATKTNSTSVTKAAEITTTTGTINEQKTTAPPIITNTSTITTKSADVPDRIITKLSPTQSSTTKIIQTSEAVITSKPKQEEVKTTPTASNVTTITSLTTIVVTLEPKKASSPAGKAGKSSVLPVKIKASTASPSTGNSEAVSTSHSTIFIAVGTTAAIILLVALAVACYRKKRRDKLPEDSDIRFLARDEVMMEGNVFNLSGTFREARNSAI